MTTILTDGRVLVSDSLVHTGGAADLSGYNKTRVTDERVYAMSGDSALLDPLVRWFEAGANPKQLPTFSPPHRPEACLWVFEGGKLYEVGWEIPYKLEIGTPNAMGSGSRWAMGALMAGASPEKAVKIATRLDIYSGGPIRVLELPLHLQILPAPATEVVMGRARGGKKRAENLTPERRSEIAKLAANSRWSA